MEYRHSSRDRKTVDVWLYKNNSLTVRGKTENLSDDGMYIKTNSLLFPINSDVEIVYSNDNSQSTKRVKAQVVHRTLNGIGLKFKQ